jgi:hypothetical protein
MKKIIVFIVLSFLSAAQDSKGQVNPGDTLQFWSVAYIDYQPSPPVAQRVINAVCKAVGTNCYFFVDEDVYTPPAPQQIESLINIYDTSFVPGLTGLYGPVPDEFDNDPRIYILIVSNEGWTGYFDPAHQMPDSMVWQIWGKHSNQKEMIYLSDDVFYYDAGMVLAHEFGHLLHWGRDHSPEPPENPVKYWEDAWIDEGFASFAPVFLLEGINQQDIYDYGAFFAAQPDLSLIYFTGGLNYNLVKLWMTFMYEHYGEEDFISALINDQANGIEGVVNTLSSLGYPEKFDESFEQWIIANYLDSKTYLNGRYGYFHYNFPLCIAAGYHTQFPTGIKTGSVSSYAADYIVFFSSAPRNIFIHFDGVDTSRFRLACLKLGDNNSQIYSVESVLPDSLNSASFYFDSLGSDIKRIVMIVMNTDPSLGEFDKAAYTYSAESLLDINDSPVADHSFILYQNYPNPFNPATRISFSIPSAGFTSLKVYDLLGKEIAVLVNEYKQAGFYEINFNAASAAGGLPSGMYFYQLRFGSFVQTKKMVVLK